MASAALVDEWAAYLEGNGVALDMRPKTHRDGARSCYFRDPDGNRVQIIHHPPISGTGHLVKLSAEAATKHVQAQPKDVLTIAAGTAAFEVFAAAVLPRFRRSAG